MHTCPALANDDITHRGMARARSASGSTIVPELLPSSSVTRFRPASWQMSRADRRAAGERDLGRHRMAHERLARRRPLAVHDARRRRPAGPPRRGSRPSATAVSGVSSAGLSTSVLPAASAGATLCATRFSGKLNGVIAAIDAHRHPQVEADAAFARRRRVHRDGLAVDPLRLFGGEHERLDAACDLAGRVLPRLPGFARDRRRQRSRAETRSAPPRGAARATARARASGSMPEMPAPRHGPRDPHRRPMRSAPRQCVRR